MKIQTGLSEQFFLVVHLDTKLTCFENKVQRQNLSINDGRISLFRAQLRPPPKIWFNTTTIVPFETIDSRKVVHCQSFALDDDFLRPSRPSDRQAGPTSIKTRHLPRGGWSLTSIFAMSVDAFWSVKVASCNETVAVIFDAVPARVSLTTKGALPVCLVIS